MKTMNKPQAVDDTAKDTQHYSLPRTLIKKVRLLAATEERSMSDVVKDALILYFEHRSKAA